MSGAGIENGLFKGFADSYRMFTAIVTAFGTRCSTIGTPTRHYQPQTTALHRVVLCASIVVLIDLIVR